MKLPVPVPFVVKLPDPKHGLAVVAQQTPLALIVPLPSEVTFPPEVTVVKSMAERTVVVTVGATTPVVVIEHQPRMR